MEEDTKKENSESAIDDNDVKILTKEDNDYIQRKKDCIADLLKDENYAIEKFDSLIISLSSGGLVFSIGFIKDVIKDFHKIDLLWLKVCWICFGLSLILNLISHVTSFYSNRFEKKALKLAIKKRQSKIIKQDPKQPERISDIFNSGTMALNGLSLLSFLTAVVTLVYFIYSNV
ncbi:hypothetical protein [Dyadobacter sp. CY312]|uniref:hypothetical protein n=1 Tax=Dyadobacter sp. CY312 TaxID=2907303 RepID=UPI001F3D1986|nr:hypothetical protein [Dyadobacter sp. CY312]MCE7044658.1 hypothetical protein [Dyadobacter sp. CY312]